MRTSMIFFSNTCSGLQRPPRRGNQNSWGVKTENRKEKNQEENHENVKGSKGKNK